MKTTNDQRKQKKLEREFKTAATTMILENNEDELAKLLAESKESAKMVKIIAAQMD